MHTATQERLRALRRERQDYAKFKLLIATPGNLVTGVTLPANAKLFASCAAVHATVMPLVTVKGKTISGDVGAANLLHVVGYAECGAVVRKAAGAAGVVTLYIEGVHGVPIKIAQG